MWQIKNSKHFKFNYLADTLAEKNIGQIIVEKENEYQRIVDSLGIENNRTITYFLYPDNTLKGELMGDDGNGSAVLEKFEVHAVYNEDIKCIGPHEDVHLLAQKIGRPTLFFREGLAEYFEKSWSGEPHDFWVNKYLGENKLPKIFDLLDESIWDETDEMISYPMAGSFVKYLVVKFGKDKFLKLYQDFNLLNLQNIYSKNLNEIESDWQNNLGFIK